jgi:hypothetical protein
LIKGIEALIDEMLLAARTETQKFPERSQVPDLHSER